MVQKSVIINKVAEFANKQLGSMGGNSPLFNIFVRPIASRAINNNIGKLDKILSAIATPQGEVDIEGIINDMVDNLIVSKADKIPTQFGKVEVGEGVIKWEVPGINKELVFSSDDLEEFKRNVTNSQM